MLWLTLVVGVVVLAAAGDAQTRRLRVRPRVLAAPSSAEYVDGSAEEPSQPADSRPQAQQYYARAQERLGDVVLVASSDEDYGGGQYGAPVAAAGRPRAEPQYARPAAKSTTAAPVAARQKAAASESRAPPVQTIRNYSKVNDDGSFTFGYEAADGSFKEETRGTDCVVRGKYGYIDPDGNKREFTYVSGNPCDPNNPDGSEEEESERGEAGAQDDSNENVPQNYPVRRPVPIAQRPTPTAAAAPARHHSTPAPVQRPTTTVFQNDYQDRRQQQDDEQEVQIGQQRGTPRPAARPFAGTVTTTQRPRIQIVSTTPSPAATLFHSPAPSPPQTVLPVNITPKPVYRVSPLPTQPTLAPTTYRPTSPSTRGPAGIDFEAEFKRFQADNKPAAPTAAAPSAPKPTGSPFGRPAPQLAPGNPIYQSQLIFDPASGQYDTALYQQLPQSDGDFQLNHRIQPFVHHHQQPPQQQQQHPAAGQLVTLEQLQQQSPLYRAQPPQPVARPPPPPTVQIPQQLYQKQQNELQFINSQQLFAQQLELQQSQLRADRLEAAKKVTPTHRFQPLPQPQPQQQQQYYFIQPQGPPQGAPGQIDAFLRGHNIEY
uniref:Cuticular protein RR family n=1 Tax=Anopheles dirus TaxID=7168 RepID=A0A182NAF0_9DIPT